MCTWVFEHSVQYTIQCLWRVVSPHCEDICVHVWYVGSRGVPSFCASIFSVRVCWEIFWSSQNDSKSSGRYSVAQDVFRPAVAVVRPPEKARRTGSCRKCFRQTFVYHLLETQAEERIKNLWKQHPDKLWEVNESLERIEVMFPAACVACRYRSPACLPLKLCWFLSLALRGALSAPLCVVVVVIYILLCFTIFSRRALDHCPFWENRYWVPNPSSSWKKCLYLGTCEPSVEVVVANVSVKGILQGVSWKPFKTCALFDVPGMQMAPCQRMLRPDELQRWLEWCWRCWRTAKPLFHYRKWPFCSHPLFSDPCVSLSFTAGCLQLHPCAHVSYSVINRRSKISLKMTRWLSVSSIFNRNLTVGGPGSSPCLESNESSLTLSVNLFKLISWFLF